MEKQIEVRKRTGLTRKIAVLAGPLVLQNMSHTLLGVVDTYFVSRISTETLAAVGLSSVMFFAVLMLFRSTANSTVVFVGRAHGERDNAKIGVAVWRSLNMVAWLAEDAEMISIRPKEPENQSLFLSRQVQQNVAWVALVILPLFFVVGGVVTWWRRR